MFGTEAKTFTHPAPNEVAVPVIRIAPSRGWVALNLADVWEYRELLYFLIWRDIKVRYKQTAFGATWAVLQPLLTMLVFSIFFGRLAKVPSDGIPYPLFSYIALVPWTFFANAMTQSSNSLVGSANLISKVYFPRLAIPLSAVLAGLVDFGIALLLAFGMMAYYRVAISWNVFLILPFLLLAVVTSLGVGLWLSALNVEYRDVRYAVPFLTQFWMFATPIAYPSSLLHEPWRTLFGLNPMVGVVEGFRWALLGSKTQPGPAVAVSASVALLVLVSGAFYFRRTEKSFADIV
jgi:lipopolysaccharide transport system permease protein